MNRFRAWRLRFSRNSWRLAASACLLASFALTLNAQVATEAQSGGASATGGDGPVAVVTLAPTDRLFKEFTTLANWIGQSQVAGLVNVSGPAYVNGLKKDVPLGVAVYLDEYNNPSPVAMIPVDDLDTFFRGLAQFGEPEDLGDGFYGFQIGPQPIYARNVGDWLFIAQQEAQLENVPADPTSLVKRMGERFLLSVSLAPQNLDTEFRDVLISQARDAFDRAMAEQAGRGGAPANAQITGEQIFGQLEKLLTETEQLAIGISVDSSEKQLGLDLATQFVKGSSLAADAAKQKEATTRFEVFENDSLASSGRFTALVPEDQAPQLIQQMEQAITAALGDAKQNAPPQVYAELEKFTDALVAVYGDTIKAGKLDMGYVLNTNETLNFVGAFEVVGGERLADATKDLAKLAEGQPRAPQFNFDAETIDGVTLHNGTFALPPGAPPAVVDRLGNPVEFALGTSSDRFFLAVGPEASGKISSLIAKTNGSTAATPAKMQINLVQILEFASEVSPNPIVENLAELLNSEEDDIVVTSQATSRGVVYRLKIDSAILESAGKMAGPGQGGF